MNRFLLGHIFILLCCVTFAQKFKGVSLEAVDYAVSEKHVKPLVELNASHVAIIPFAFMPSLNEPKLSFGGKDQWYGESLSGIRSQAKYFKKENIKLVIKPQIWIWNGKYCGHIRMNDGKDWRLFEEKFSNYIITYAKLAEQVGADLFSIGTELDQFVKTRPSFWNRLIKSVRSVYKGEITYSANWDEYFTVPFWKQLDYIGVDAYFPLSISKTPSVKELKSAWKIFQVKLSVTSSTYNKKVVFMECGYRSVNYGANEPWESSPKDFSETNLEVQKNAYQAMFEVFWNLDWFEGAFLWKWNPNHEHSGGTNDNRFTPQNKPAEIVIREWYSGN